MDLFGWITNPEIWVALLSLTALEIVLGIDNIVFISILAGKLPKARQVAARNLGLMLAMVMRIGLLFSISLIMKMSAPLFALVEHDFSGRDLVLIGGGLFLLGKSTFEIHDNLEGGDKHGQAVAGASFGGVILQILALDLVFSLDSVITAVGMAKRIGVMVAAVVIAVGVMLVAAGMISRFVESHPTVKMLALSFLLLVGMALVADGVGQHIPKGYIYFAMGFSVFVEGLNLRMKARRRPVELHGRYAAKSKQT